MDGIFSLLPYPRQTFDLRRLKSLLLAHSGAFVHPYNSDWIIFTESKEGADYWRTEISRNSDAPIWAIIINLGRERIDVSPFGYEETHRAFRPLLIEILKSGEVAEVLDQYGNEIDFASPESTSSWLLLLEEA